MDIHGGPILFLGKIVLALVMFGAAAGCIVVLRRSRAWQEKLVDLEAECDSARDSVVVQATMLRAQMADFNDRLAKRTETGDMEAIGKLVKQAVPVITMFARKETSLFRWGLAGLKLVRGALKYFSGPANN